MTRKFVYWELLAVSLLLTAVWFLAPLPALASDNITATVTGDVVDYITPAKVADLAVSSRTQTSLTLTWTAPGDDGNLGTASQYDIRYSSSAIDTEARWQAATAVSAPPTPQAPGSTETFTVTGLSSGTRYYFALKTADEVPNWSDLSNSPLGITSPPISLFSYVPVEVYFAGQTSLLGKISQKGVILSSVTAESFDGLLTLGIDKGTTALTRYGAPLKLIGMYEMKSTPSPPEAAYIVSIMYDLQPDGATFTPSATLAYIYDPGHIPEDVDEQDLVIAQYDRNINEWVNLDCVVDTEAKIITAKVSHFTPFAVFAYRMIVPPAIFECSALSISPSEVNIGEVVNISILAANTGGELGWCEVTLKINGEIEVTRHVTLAAGTSKPISFTTFKNTAGTYSVVVNGLTGSFTVRGKSVPPPPPPAEPAPAKPINWWLIGGVIAAVAAVAGLVYLFLIYRRYKHVAKRYK